MRFYAVKIEGAPVAFERAPGTPFVPGAQFCSVIDTGGGFGFRNDPSALRCQMHFEMTAAHTAVVGGFVRLWGPDLSMLSQASNLVNLPCWVYGGFWGGGPRGLALDLAKAEAPFAGIVYSGRVLTAMGNWVGQDMTLDIFLSSAGPPQAASGGQGGSGGGGDSGVTTATAQRLRQRQRVGRPIRHLRPPVSPTQFDSPLGGLTGDISSLASAFSTFMSGGWQQNPINMIHNMMPGMDLSSAMQQTLSTVFPTSKVVSLIKSGLTLPYQDAGFYQTLGQYAGYAKTLSKSIVNGAGGASGLGGLGSALGVSALAAGGGGGSSGGSYDGVSIFPVKDKIFLYDGTHNSGEVTLRFIDLIGQPTWVKPGTINFMTPMRADIVPTITVTMPPNTLQSIAANAGNMYGQTGEGSGILPHSLAINFQGSFTVQTVMVVGDSRHPDGKSWALSVQATLGGAGGAGQSGGSGTTEA